MHIYRLSIEFFSLNIALLHYGGMAFDEDLGDIFPALHWAIIVTGSLAGPTGEVLTQDDHLRTHLAFLCMRSVRLLFA